MQVSFHLQSLQMKALRLYGSFPDEPISSGLQRIRKWKLTGGNRGSNVFAFLLHSASALTGSSGVSSDGLIVVPVFLPGAAKSHQRVPPHPVHPLRRNHTNNHGWDAKTLNTLSMLRLNKTLIFRFSKTLREKIIGFHQRKKPELRLWLHSILGLN